MQFASKHAWRTPVGFKKQTTNIHEILSNHSLPAPPSTHTDFPSPRQTMPFLLDPAPGSKYPVSSKPQLKFIGHASCQGLCEVRK